MGREFEMVDQETGELLDDITGYETLTSRPIRVPAEIIKARIAVMKGARGVGKSGRNKFHNYDYASDEDVLGLLQPLMAEHGLLLEMRPVNIEFDKDGNVQVRFDMVWMHESGAVADPVPWYGVASDRDKGGKLQDKWFNKAATAAEKYFLLKQFHIPAGKNSDPDANDNKPDKHINTPEDIEREALMSEPDTQAPLYFVPILRNDDGGSDWAHWASQIESLIKQATTNAILDQIKVDNKPAFVSCTKQSPDIMDSLSEAAKARREEIGG